MQKQSKNGGVEIIRDRWGVAHIFAEKESDGFYGVGYVCAQDRLLQMELLRRRAYGRVAELFGPDWIDSDRRFRLGGIQRYCAAAFANLPPDLQENLRAYASGVNGYAAANPESVQERFAPLGISPDPWAPADCIAAWVGHAEMFDLFIDDRTYGLHDEVKLEDASDPFLEELYLFQRLVVTVGEEEAFERRGRVVDDEMATVPESEMAKFTDVYARLKAMKPTPGFQVRGTSPQPIRFSHTWAVDGTRSTTGKPILESDPQTPVNNPPIYYSYHLCAGRYNVRGVGAPGGPAMLIGFNHRLAWGGSALGIGCTVNFLEKLSADGRGYQLRGEPKPFDRRLERIDVNGGETVVQEVYTNPHGFVFNSMARGTHSGEAYVSHYKMAQDAGTSVRALLEMMRANNWDEFVAGMEHYYSPGMNITYADVDGNIAYHTLAYIPLTKRSRRWVLEGWTGEDEVLGRIPLEEMPHMVNPDSHALYSANHMPVGSWYPYDLGLASGAGAGPRATRLRQLLAGDRVFSPEEFETDIHRDNVNPVVAMLLPVARKVVGEDGVKDPQVLKVLAALEDWDMHFDAAHPAYWTAMVLSDMVPKAYRRTNLRDRLTCGMSGASHLARLVGERFSRDGATPQDPDVRAYLIDWLRITGELAEARGISREDGTDPEPHRRVMPYQASERISFPSVKPELDFVSPPLTCGQTQTIWSQNGNSYTQIVDLSDLDNSRAVLSPGISEDPESRFYLNQKEIWLKGTTHPAPLSRHAVEAVAVSGCNLTAMPYVGPDATQDMVIEDVPEGARFIPAIPESSGSEGDRPAKAARGLADEMYTR